MTALDAPHHLRVADFCDYREGVVVDRPVKKGRGSYVDIGLSREVQIDELLVANVRVTVKFDSQQQKNPGVCFYFCVCFIVQIWLSDDCNNDNVLVVADGLSSTHDTCQSQGQCSYIKPSYNVVV